MYYYVSAKKIIPLIITIIILFSGLSSSAYPADDQNYTDPVMASSRFLSPVRIVQSKTNIFYVSDYLAESVFEVKLKNGNFKKVKRIKIKGNPLGIAVLKDGRKRLIFIGNARKNRVEVYNDRGRFIDKFSTRLRRPNDITITPDKRIYVVASDDNMVRIFNRRGRPFGKFGKFGSGDGEFNFPTGITYNKAYDEIVVSDFMNKRIQVFSRNGKWKRSFGGGMFLSVVDRPQGLGVDRYGNVYVADSQQATVHVFNYMGIKIRSFGAYGKNSGQLRTPLDVLIDKRGNVYVTSNLNSRIELFKGAAK